MMFCGWEGNHRSGMTLAMHHRLSCLFTHGSVVLGVGGTPFTVQVEECCEELIYIYYYYMCLW